MRLGQCQKKKRKNTDPKDYLHRKMANSNIPSGFLRASLQNGLGRYVCQLKRLTLTFCKERADSLGARDMVQNRLIDFTKHNPSVAVYAQVRRHKAPALVAEYLNGQTHHIAIAKKDSDEITEWLDFLRTRSGEELYRIRKAQHTEYPSTQGTWTPLTHKPMYQPDVTFPDKELSKAFQFKKSASDLLLELAKNKKNAENEYDRHGISGTNMTTR